MAVAISIAASCSAAAADGIFANLAGSWSGTGTIKLSGGTSEPIRCRATYAVENGDNTLRQQLRCASDSYKFDVQSSVTYNGDAGLVKGTWSETTNGVGGFVSGPATAERIKARVHSSTFDADLELVTKGLRQSVTIRPKNLDVSEVMVELRKS